MAQLLNAGEYATEGERQAAETLRNLPAEWVVIANKVLPVSGHRSFEIDFIVIGDRAVYIIDEKSWGGRIHGSDQIWVREDGSSERSPLAKVDYIARLVAGKLRDSVPFHLPAPAHFVEGRVLLSRIAIRPSLRDPRAASGVLLLHEAVEQLQHQDAAAGDPQVGEQRNAIRRVLYDLSDRPKIPQAIGPYRIDEVVPGPHGSYQCRATHPESGTRMISLYPVAGADPALRDFYLREYRALQKLRASGVTPEVMDPFSWSEDYLAVPAYLPDGISLKALRRATGGHAATEELQIAAGAFRALAKVHAMGVTHRAIGPESVYIGVGVPPTVMFTGFFAAREGTATIAPKLDELHMADPYAAPEIALGYGFADTTSDTYALALVFLERLSGVPISRLVHTHDGIQEVKIPDPDAGWESLPPDIIKGLIGFFRRALAPGSMAPASAAHTTRLTAAQCAEELDVLAASARGDQERVKGQLLDGRYTIQRLLGTGSSARSFLVTDNEADGLFVIKQFLRPDILRESGEARREFSSLRSLHSEHLPRVYDIYPQSADAHVKMEYVEGASLTESMHTYLLRPDRWRRLAEDLLEAVRALEREHLLHRDIKPANVIIRDGSEAAVLIDFGLATVVDRVATPAGTPRYLPPESYDALQPPPSTDRYALAVLLFDALFGYVPFADIDGRPDQGSLLPLDRTPDTLRHIAGALLRAVDPDPGRRYTSIAQFADSLAAALGADEDKIGSSGETPLIDLINPWVDQLRSLFRNSRRGNADNRGMDSPFAHQTYVETALDTWLWPAILRDRPRVVFLSGNPGDGKTAFLERVRERLKDLGAEQLSPAIDGSGWEWQLDGHVFRACYDASEAHEGRSADEQLRARLRELEGESPSRLTITVLVAINDGRLADVVEKFQSAFPWLVKAIDAAQRPGATRDPGGIWLIDLKRRSYASPISAAERSVLRRMLDTLVAPTEWDVCKGCAARHECPIRQNALALSEAGNDAPAARLEYALLLAHLRGKKHLTVRDVRSGLAYLLTGDLGCKEVHAARAEGNVPGAEYWRLAFSTDSDRDIMLGELQPLDPGRFAQPRLERFLFFHQDSAETSMRERLYRNGRDLPPRIDVVTWLEHSKQRLYFESTNPAGERVGAPSATWSSLLPYQHAGQFTAILSGQEVAAELLSMIARGVSRSDGLGGAALSDGLCIKVAHSDSQHMTVLKRFPLDEFTLVVAQPPGGVGIETQPIALLLRHVKSQARLSITLDIFELLMRLAEGLEPDSPELQALIEDLVPFKSRVQMSSSHDLVLIESGRRMHQLTQHEGQLVCLPLEIGMVQ